MRCRRLLLGVLAVATLVSGCSPGGEDAEPTTSVDSSTTTTEPPLDIQAHAEPLLVGIRSEGDFLEQETPGSLRIGEGTGVVIAEDGLILTSATSVVGADRINIYIPGEEFPVVGELDSAAECVNLALVRVDHTFEATLPTEPGGPPFAVASADEDGVVALPTTASQSIAGFILAGSPNVPTGGVIFDDEGGFSGIVTGYESSGNPVALTAEETVGWVRDMRQRNVVQQLGFLSAANTDGLPVVAAIAASGPGADLGLEIGDVITKAGERELVGGIGQLCTAMEDGTVELEVIKNGRRHLGKIPGTALVLASYRSTDQIREAVVEVDTGRGTGSGFYISPDGLLVTNYHVAGAESTVGLRSDASDELISGEVIAASACADLALIQAEPGEYQYLEWSPEPPQLEQEVRVIGFPLATRTISFQDGIVAKEAAPSTNWVGSINTFETSAVIDNGNSGGPVVNADGEVIGVSYAARTREDSVVQRNLHLVGVEAHALVDQMRDGSLVDPGFRFGGSANAGYLQLRSIDDVAPSGSAASAGLRSGDGLAQFGELESYAELSDFADICSYVEEAGPDAVHEVVGYRPSTEAYFDGQINGAPVREWPEDFRQQSIDRTISAMVPGPWDDIEPIEPVGNDWVGFFAAPDMTDYYGRFGTAPGMRLMWSYERGDEFTTESWFDSVPYSNLATSPPEEFWDYSYTGHYQYFETPGGSLSVEFALRELGEAESPLILLYISLPDGLIPRKVVEIFDSLETDLPPRPETDGD